MLQSFLNRLAQHPILRRDHVVHRFLTGDASWVPPSPNIIPDNIERSPSYPSNLPATQKHSQSTTREPRLRRRRPTLQRNAHPQTIRKTKGPPNTHTHPPTLFLGNHKLTS